MESSLDMKIQKNSLLLEETAQNPPKEQKENGNIWGLNYSPDHLIYMKLVQFTCTTLAVPMHYDTFK